MLQRLVEILAGVFDEFHDRLITNGGTQCQRVDEHADGVADAQVGTPVADGGDAQLFAVGES